MTATDPSPVPDYLGRLRLDGRAIAVLGAGQGIGRQVAHAVTAAGALAICVDVLADLAAEVAEEVGGRPCVADLRTPEGMESVLEAARGTGVPLRGAIDIVGQARWAGLTDISDEDYRWALGVNLDHAFLALRHLGGHLVEQGDGGALVFVASISGTSSAPFHAAYGAAKAGLLSLVRTAAVELGPAGVRVNAVSPGTTETPRMLSRRTGTEPPPPEPLGKHARPADIAGAALFLVGDLAGHVTGQNLIVDGGVTCRYPIDLSGVVAAGR
jgi:NAD(P)-dependent dehydrogenase (short-subunit alcohol dehydrogenase family)